MRQMKFAIFALLFIIIASCASSLGKKEKNNASGAPANSVETINTGNQTGDGGNNGNSGNSMGNTIKITGKIQIYGNEPHTFVGIVAEDGAEYAVYPPSKEEELRTLQGYLIEFTVVLLDEPQGFGSLFLKGGTVTPIEWTVK
jgi:hypothetical protein